VVKMDIACVTCRKELKGDDEGKTCQKRGELKNDLLS